ncbi:hypothetical protein GALMADRAFT_443338 [Galerina marginata CBS 339.88]|uniref:Uncharacterized protein n=1 Tax=Galerina marginata (strain CBS 339.88) TaxID=685588 RepID=A0A067TBS9_GALM3|nr:hypothetical protein GALMADRAFT_443338 [Galerina marginata CBS 339.88]
MAKRGVPAALHRELSEYASLLRALRVRDAMDITKQLTKPSPFVLQDNDLNYDQDEYEDEGEDLPVAGPSHSNHPINAQPSTKSDKARGKEPADRPKLAPKQRRRDHWTRWPLPLNDVLVPEWTLEDEVAVIASQIMKSRPPLAFPVPSHGLDDSDDEDGSEDEEERVVPVRDIELDSDDPDPPYYVPYLTSTVANYLSTIFAVLASHTPARPASMQNRIEPLNWRAVIDVVVSCGNPEFANSNGKSH